MQNSEIGLHFFVLTLPLFPRFPPLLPVFVPLFKFKRFEKVAPTACFFAIFADYLTNSILL